MVITDAAGNNTSYTFTIDTAAPELEFTGISYSSGTAMLTNTAFNISITDYTSTVIYYRLGDSGDYISYDGTSFTVTAEESNYGTWYVYAVDAASNKTATYTIGLYYRSDFGNLNEISKGYTVAVWYETVLPTKYYSTNTSYPAATYYFADYSSALAYAVEAEWSRVSVTANGWSYAALSNASTFVEYTDYDTLVSVIDYYAASRVSEREIYSSSGSGPDNTDGTLTVQDLTLPSVLSDYSSYQLLLVQHTFAFTRPAAGVSGNTRYATIQYLSDGYTLREGSVIYITYGTALKSVLTAGGCYLQGYFLVTEYDLCGNLQTYILYLDLDIPELTVSVVYGSGTAADLSIDETFVTDNDGVMRYVSFEITSLADSMDSYSFIVIDGKNLSSEVYLNTDELPVLSYANGYYGVYTITIYDRSLNSLSFSITIAGEDPTITTTSLTSETRVKITISINDSDNVLSEVHIYKITYYGEYMELSEDDAGTAVSASETQYIIKTGGKYAVLITDAFGRTVTIEFFYQKDLPTGTLSGVKDGGITNSDVTFKYSSSYTVELYVYDSSTLGWVDADEDLYTYTEGSSSNTITIIAGESTSCIYKIFLYVTEDKNLYMEYEFEIDAIPPSVQICTDSETLEDGAVTTSPFYITWTEASLTVTYTTSKSSLYTYSYSKNTYINTDYIYYFTATDTAGNTTSFEITLDSTVSYTLTGSYTYTSDGTYVSKKSLTFTVNEQIGSWECESDNGLAVTNAQTITTNGIYCITVTDAYGNAMQITLIIDNIAPTPVITAADGQTVEKNGSINKAFTVTCEEEGATITYSLTNSGYTVYDGSELSDSVKYYFVISDIYGNSEEFTVTCDYVVSYTVSGTYTQLSDTEYITAKSNVYISVNESYAVFSVASDNGYTYAEDEKFSQEGVYEITITDLAGNTVVLTLTVDKTPPEPVITAEDGRTVEKDGSINCAFTVSCDESGATITYSTDNNKFYAYGGEDLSGSGMYYFKVTDVAGNVTSFTVTCDYAVSYAVNGTYTQLSDTEYITAKSNVYISVNESYAVFSVASDNGYTYAEGEKFSQEGVYEITITDLAGNTVVLTLTVDKTPPEPVITAEDGRTVEEDGSINCVFTVSCDEDGATITYSTDGSRYYAYSGGECANICKYYFRITDAAGNVTEFTVTRDPAVDVTITGSYVQSGSGVFYFKSYFILTVNESYSVFEYTSTSGTAVKDGTKVSAEGTYVITVTDLAGNTEVFTFVIDKTAPEPFITKVNGTAVEAGSSVNSAFTVSCEESDAVITYSADGSKYYAYSGEEISGSGTYYFKVTDVAGNVTSFTVTCDYAVKYTLGGTYTQSSDTEYITAKSNVYISVNESYAVFSVASDNGYTYAEGEKFAEEGVYSITITDLAGNTVVLTLTVDKSAPEIELQGAEDSGNTAQDVIVTFSENVTVGGTEYAAGESITYTEEGSYTITATDAAGNKTTVTFTIDKSVDVTISQTLITGQILCGAVTFTFNETLAAELNNDGTLLAYSGGKITENGSYSIKFSDALGNTASYSFTIISEVASGYKFYYSDNYTAEIIKDGALYFGGVTGNSVTLSEDGVYLLTFTSEEGSFSVELTVDTGSPTVEITKNRTSVVIANPSKDNVTVTVYKDGEQVNYTLGESLTGTGSYMVVVEDELGNSSVYNFTLDYINGYGIALIAIGCPAVSAIAVVAIVLRRKQRLR